MYPASQSLGPTGVGRWIVGAVGALARLVPEWQIHFVMFSYKAPAIDVSWMGDNVSFSVVRRPAKLYRSLRGSPLLPPIDATFGRADVMLGAGYVPWRGRDLAEVPVVYDLSVIHYPQTVSRKHLYFLKLALATAIRRAPVIATISHAMKEEIIRHFEVDPRLIRVVHPGCDLDHFAAPLEQRPEGLPDPGYLLFVGTIEPRKNLPALLEAYRRLKIRRSDIPPLVIAGGTGWRIADLLRELREDSLTGNVHVLGYVNDEDLPRLYADAGAFIMPSHYEGFGIPPLEAMASGCPVIVSDRAALPEVVGDAGLLVDPSDPSSIADAIVRVIDDPKLRSKLTSAGRKQAQRFTWDNSGRALKEVLEMAVAESAARRRS